MKMKISLLRSWRKSLFEIEKSSATTAQLARKWSFMTADDCNQLPVNKNTMNANDVRMTTILINILVASADFS